MHQGMGLTTYNTLPMRRAVHAVYECCGSVPLAADLARGRPYADHDALFRRAEALLSDIGEPAARDELTRCGRARLARMLGPEGGYDNW